MSLTSNAFAKLKWRCRRGTKELDFLLGTYLEQRYSNSSIEEQKIFVEFLTFSDSLLILYLLGDGVPEAVPFKELANKIKQLNS